MGARLEHRALARQYPGMKRVALAAGVNPDKDVTVALGGDAPTLLQALVNGSIPVAILSPPTVTVARDKNKMNILAGVGLISKVFNFSPRREINRELRVK
jgi:ABC-type nitrate/sulfonate/bicarbonate transport system substrate-binding protein